MRGTDIVAQRAAIEALRDRHGRITAAAVVDAARDPNNPLHAAFDWNVERAAEQHWLDTARRLISAVRVNISIGSRVVSAVCYVRDPTLDTRQGGYRELTTIAARRDDAVAVVEMELARIAAAIQRARSIAAVLDLEGELEALLGDLTLVRAKIGRATKKRRRAAAAERGADDRLGA